MRKPAFCICKNKGADQRLCFRLIDRTIPLLSKSEIEIDDLSLGFLIVSQIDMLRYGSKPEA